MKNEWTCKQCGKCCRWVTFLYNPTPDQIKYYSARENFVIGKIDGMNIVMIKSRCKFVTQDNECSIYKDRPEACRKFKEEECETLGELLCKK